MHFNSKQKTLQTLTLKKIFVLQGKDIFCQQAANEVICNRMEFSLSEDKNLIWRALLDGALKLLVQKSLPRRMLYTSHHTPVAGRPGKRRVYETIRKDYYRSYIEMKVFQSIRDWHSYTIHETWLKHKLQLQTFPEIRELNFVAIEVLRRFQKNNIKENDTSSYLPLVLHTNKKNFNKPSSGHDCGVDISSRLDYSIRIPTYIYIQTMTDSIIPSSS